MFTLGRKSREKLKGVHPHLVKVVERAIQISKVDFTVGETLRTLERQKELFAKGASKTMNSRHLTGHAVDLYALKNGKVTWEQGAYTPIVEAMKQAAKELGVAITCGRDWKKFVDSPHFELDWKIYPK